MTMEVLFICSFLHFCFVFFFFKQKTAYEMRISDWSSDVCSSDLRPDAVGAGLHAVVDWAFAALRSHPHDILRGVLDVAGLAVHAVLRIDLQAVLACVGLDEFLHAGRTVSRFGAALLGPVDRHRNRGDFKRMVYRFVLFALG